MRETLVQRVAGRIDNVARRIEIRFPDLEMNDVAPLGLERSCFDQNLKRRLRAEARHSPGQSQFASVSHDGESTFQSAAVQHLFLSARRSAACICSRSPPDYVRPY